MLTLLRRILLGAAIACLVFFGGLIVLEETGVVTRLVRAKLARELGPLGERLQLDDAELAWFEPGIELTGVSLALPGAEGTSVLLERVHAVLSPGLRAVRGLRFEGGRVLVGPQLIEDWNALAAARAARADTPPPLALPPASVHGLTVELQLFDRSRIELGTLDLCARPGAAGAIELAGRLAPSLGGAVQSREPVRVSGEFSPASVRLWASARDLALETRALPSGALERPLPLLEGSASLTLHSSFELTLGETARPRGHVRAALGKGRLRLASNRPLVDDLAFELEADLAPAEGENPWTRESWDACAALHARVDATPVWAWAELGRDVPEGAWAHVWGSAHGIPLEREALTALGVERHFTFLRELLAPRGRLDLAGALLLGRARASWTRDLAVHARARGELGVTYMGSRNEPRSGVPLPLSGVRGDLVLGERTGTPRPWRLSMLDVTAEHGSGSLSGWGQITAPAPGTPAPAHPELDFVLATPSLAVDAVLLRALAENQHLEWIGPSFAPEGGTLACDWRLRTGPDVGGTSGAGTLRVRGLSLSWSEVPVRLDGLEGELSVLFGRSASAVRDQPLLHRRPFGVAYRFDNRGGPRVGAEALVEGWVREEPLPPVFDPAAPPVELVQDIRIEIDELGLRGRDFDVLAARFPALEREVASYGAVGRMRVSYRGAQPAPGLPFRSEIEATPIEVHVRPQFFQRQTRDLGGRILIQTQERDEVEESASQLALTGTWPGGVELFARGTIPERGEARVHVFGAGIDPTNTSFKGALITSLASGTTVQGGIDLSSWTLEGPVDFALETTFDPASPAPAENRFRIQLRDNDLRTSDLYLRDLTGTFEQVGDVLASPLVEATLGGHPIELRNVLTFPFAVLPRVAAADPWLAREGFWKDPNGRALQADLHVERLPLDAEHLAGLLDAEALETLRRNPSWRGLIDVQGARLLVTSEADNQGKVAMRGAMRPHDLAMRLGLPIRVESARVALEELVLESGRFRGWARISELHARIAEREISDASMIAGYVDGRLTIDNLSGDFEGGRLESLGGALGGASKALGIDLAEPHRFDVAVSLSDVNVGGLLRGVFQSSIADEGVLDASLQLSGTPSDVLALTGRGSLSLDEGALWSIPVMRELFAQLGFEKGGLFDRLRTRFELRDGRIQLSHVEIRSALLDLVGEGWQDLDGTLSYDLEVRYGLLDRLGPFGRMLYWLNNSLMRVAVRGDFERPKVTIRNSILELVTGFDDDPGRKLPLPKFSALGPRF